MAIKATGERLGGRRPPHDADFHTELAIMGRGRVR
jgi:hypothetical protein